MSGNLTIARIAGIPVRINWTWLIAFAVITFGLAVGTLPANYENWATQVYWGVAVLASLLFFASVVAHEFSHALMARAKGLEVNSITLFVLGGVTEIEEEARSPMREFLVAAVGPASSLAIGLVALLLAPLARMVTPQAGALMDVLALANLSVGIFNVLPAFPMDGGRILRAVFWGRTGSLIRATRYTVPIGRVFAWSMLGFGAFMMFNGNFSGIWLAVLGFWLDGAAQASRTQIETQELLRGARMEEAMRTDIHAILPMTSVSQLVEEIVPQTRQKSFPVYGGGRLWGVVSVADVAKVPRDRWAFTSVDRIMSPRDRLRLAAPGDPAEMALKELGGGKVDHLVVVDENEQPVGIVGQAELINFLDLRQHLSRTRAA
jgi:Zn-dependent protease/CBS domain-containing protein